MESSYALDANLAPDIKAIKMCELENERLRSENFELKQELSHYRNHARTGDTSPLEALKNENKQLIDQLNAMAAERERIKNEVGRLLAETEKKERALAERENECRSGMAGYVEREAKYNSMINELRAAEKRLMDENKGHVHAVNQLRTENKGLLERSMAIEKKLSDTMRVLEALREDNNENVGSIGKLREQKCFFENVVNEQTTKIKALEESNGVLENEIKNVNTSLRLREEENRRLTNENARLASTLENYKKKVGAHYVHKYGQVEEENAKLKEQNREVLRSLDDLRGTHERAGREYERLSGEYRMLQDRYDAAMNKVKEQQYVISEKQNEAVQMSGNVLKQSMRVYDTYERLVNVCRAVKRVKEKLAGIGLSTRNENHLRRLRIGSSLGINTIVRRLVRMIDECRRKNSSLEKEVLDMSSFAKNNRVNSRTIRLIEEFSREFEDARNGLNECQVYLERKGNENRLLRNEIRRLRKCHRCAL